MSGVLHVLAVVLVLVVLAAAGLLTVGRILSRTCCHECEANLVHLGQIQNAYQQEFGRLPDAQGEELWLRIAPASLLQCPLEGVEDPGSDYRGPADDVNDVDAFEIVGADVEGNHGKGWGGCILRKNGEVRIVVEQETVWTTARARTTGGSAAFVPDDPPPWRFWLPALAASVLALLRCLTPRRVRLRPAAFWPALVGLLALAAASA